MFGCRYDFGPLPDPAGLARLATGSVPNDRLTGQFDRLAFENEIFLRIRLRSIFRLITLGIRSERTQVNRTDLILS